VSATNHGLKQNDTLTEEQGTEEHPLSHIEER